MENDKQVLSEYLTSTAAALETRDSDSGDQSSGTLETIHLELIDFDLLGRNLNAAAREIEKFQTLEGECAVVRQWFLDRIAAMRRGRRAILSDKSLDTGIVYQEPETLPQLMRRFEEEAARLRSTASRYHAGDISLKYKETDDYRSFKA